MDGEFSSIDCLAGVVLHLTDVIESDFREMVGTALEGNAPKALTSLRRLDLFRHTDNGKQLFRWLDLHIGVDVSNRLFAKLTDLDQQAGESLIFASEALTAGTIAARAGRPVGNREAYGRRRLDMAASSWDDARHTAVDAADYAADVMKRAVEIAFIASDMQELILTALDGKAMTQEDLCWALGTGEKPISTSTLYGKGGRGGLNQLLAIGLVKNDRRIGGYYRPTAPPPRMRTKGEQS